MKQFIQYTYDLAGNRTRMIEPGGGRFTCAYDSLDRLSTLENPQSQRTTFSYDDNSRRTASRLSNDSRASFTYDAASNITRLANLKSDLTTLSSFDYRYDKVSNRQAMIEGDGARTTYSYDNAYQLLGEFRTGSSAYRNTYTYDNAANRTLKNESGVRTTTTYDAANQINYALAAAGRTTYTYDADGNQQRALEPSGARTTTLWDYENKTRLIQVPSGVRNTMSYEPDGLRVQVQNSLGTSRFIYDGQAYLLETDGSNVTVAVFTNEPSAYTNAISQRRGSTTSWFQFDALGSTRQLSDASQNITDTYLSNAWGVPLTATGSTTNWLRYVGRYGYWFELDTENYNIGQRIYRPVIARWTSVDQLPGARSACRYCYVGNRLLLFVDPSGLLEESPPTSKGVATTACTDRCGPDVTTWFYNDLRDVYKRAKAESDKFKADVGAAPAWAAFWARTAKYDFAHKWMDFSAQGCATGKCRHTVMLAGTCVRKNVLGNIAYGFFQQAFPPFKFSGMALQPLGWATGDPIEFGYKLGPIYPNDPALYGAYAGNPRADNLAAFGIGFEIAGPTGLTPLSLKDDGQNVFEFMLSGLYLSQSTLNKYSRYYNNNAGATFNSDTLTFIPEFGGFNTKSCQPCNGPDGKLVHFKGVTSQAAFKAIEAIFSSLTGDKGSIDDWLKKEYENYYEN